jgi:hypothetical protein
MHTTHGGSTGAIPEALFFSLSLRERAGVRDDRFFLDHGNFVLL